MEKKQTVKMPGRCPICNDPMPNTFEHHYEVLRQKCNKRISHNIEFIAAYKPSDNDLVQHITIIDGNRRIWWNLRDETLYIHILNGVKGNMSYLPYFKPNLSQFSKLMEKIKTYLLFS